MRESAWEKSQEVQVRVLPNGVPLPTSFLVHRAFPNAQLCVASDRTASVKFVRKCELRGQSRSSTAREHPKKFGRRGFDSHRARQFRRAAEFGLSAKRETASAFKPRTIGQPMDSHLASCPSFSFFGWAAVLRLSNWVAQLRQSIS